jgi:Zn-dependent peptidase ImmA (M78 family)
VAHPARPQAHEDRQGGRGLWQNLREEHDAYYLAAATLLPKTAMIDAVSKNRSSEQIAGVFGTSSELVDYRIKRLGLWREHVGKQIRLTRD